MSINKNSNGNENILEISKTAVPVFTSGFYKSIVDKAPQGGKVKCSSTGDLSVHYVGDAAGTYRTLTVVDANVWLSDRIDEIQEAGTTVPIANILFGW